MVALPGGSPAATAHARKRVGVATWLGTLPALAVSLLVLLAPGLATGIAIGLRGIWLWGSAPGISLAALAGASVLSPLLGLDWNPGTAALLVVALCVALVTLVRLVLRSSVRYEPATSPMPHARWWTAGGLLVAAGLLFAATVIGVGTADSFSQTFDNLFHLGVSRYIIETGNASPFWVGTFASPGSSGGFYPDLWHSGVVLVAELTGSALPVAINAFNLAVTVVVWPVGVLLLVRQFAPLSPAALMATGVLSSAFPAFPLNLLTYGVLYPLFLALALLPAALSALMRVLGCSRDDTVRGRIAIAVVGLISAAAIGLSHPSAFMALLAFSVPVVIAAYVRSWQTISARLRLLSTVAVLSYFVVGVVLLRRIHTSFQWPPQSDLDTVIEQTITGNYLGAGFGFLVGALALAGTIIAVIRRDAIAIAAAGIWIIGATLYVSAAGVENPLIRRLVAAWYADTPRLGAIAVISIIPIAVIGFIWLYELLLRLPQAGRSIATFASTVILVAILATSGYPQFLQKMRMSYDYRSSEYIDSIPAADRGLLGNLTLEGTYIPLNNVLSPDELQLLERLPQHVPEDAVIAGNPWTGTTLAYAFEGRRVIPPYLTTGLTPDQAVIMQGFALQPDDPRVCNALKETGVRFILDFGEREVHGGHNSYPGIEHLDNNQGVRLVDQQGEAKLFEITSCGLGD